MTKTNTFSRPYLFSFSSRLSAILMLSLFLILQLFFIKICQAENQNTANQSSSNIDHSTMVMPSASPESTSGPTSESTSGSGSEPQDMSNMQHDMSGMEGMSTNSTEPNPHAAHLLEMNKAATPQANAPATKDPAPTDKDSSASDTKVTKAAKIAAPPPPEFIEKLGAIVPSDAKLRDENGEWVNLRSRMDIPTIIVPIFFTCPAACNILQSSIVATLAQVELKPGKDFRVLVVSFDESDTPAMATRKKANYLAAMNYKFPASEISYLTGDLESIKHFMDSIGFPYIRLGVGNFSHPVGIIVLGPGGKVTRYLYGQGFMPFDITMAVNEAAEGKIGLSIKRFVTYCFSYDPSARKYVFNITRVAGVVILFGILALVCTLVFGGKKKKNKESIDKKDKE